MSAVILNVITDDKLRQIGASFSSCFKKCTNFRNIELYHRMSHYSLGLSCNENHFRILGKGRVCFTVTTEIIKTLRTCSSL